MKYSEQFNIKDYGSGDEPPLVWTCKLEFDRAPFADRERFEIAFKKFLKEWFDFGNPVTVVTETERLKDLEDSLNGEKSL